MGNCPKKGGGAWTVWRFKGGLSKKEGIVFLRGSRYPNAHYACSFLFIWYTCPVFLKYAQTKFVYKQTNKQTKKQKNLRECTFK